MAANLDPIYPITQNIGKATLLTADTSFTAPTTAGAILITGGTNGTRIDGIKVRALGTNVATVLRIFFCDGLGTAATNFALVHEIALAATTSATSAITGVDTLLLPINYDNAGNGAIPPYLKSGQKIYVSLGTTVASGFAISCYGGDY